MIYKRVWRLAVSAVRREEKRREEKKSRVVMTAE